MERLRGSAVLVVATVLLIFSAAVAVAGDDPTIPNQYSALLQDDEIAISGEQNLEDPGTGGTRRFNERTKISSQPVCIAAAVLTNLGTCNAPESFCPNPADSTPVWVMTAPSGDPAAEDWVNTGRIRCLATRAATPAVVINAEQFRRLRIPAPQIITQPNPAVRPTLINIDTNFLTEKKSVILPTTVLGQPIRVLATPASYLWTYGDGQQLRTTSPGDLYPNIQTPHVYLQPGSYTVQLQTTFTGEYSVSGGPWQPIQGTATTTSPSTTVTAEEKRAVLIS